MKRQHGFTLLELLMVVIIIGILASIALPQYLRVTERTRASEALQLLSATRSAEQRFRAQDPAGNYTTNPTQLDIDLPLVLGAVQTPSWDIVVSTAAAPGTGAAGPNAEATRRGGPPYGGLTIFMDLNTGNTCAEVDINGNNVYGLPAPSAAC